MGRFNSPGADKTALWGRAQRSMASVHRLNKEEEELAP
jgi:hypothetical protein